MHYDRRHLDDMARHLLKAGYFFYRHQFPWGVSPSFRNVPGTRFYFIAEGEVLTPRQMHAHLLRTWNPETQEEVMFFQNRLSAHFATLPGDVPDWDGASPEQMIAPEKTTALAGIAETSVGAYAL
jgi:hypothetical protein